MHKQNFILKDYDKNKEMDIEKIPKREAFMNC
jgi:hypothetical protein